MATVKCMQCGVPFEIDTDLKALKERYPEIEFHCVECNAGWVGVYVKSSIDVEKKTVEGVFSVVDYNEANMCAGGPAWASLIGDNRLCEHNLKYEDFFKEFVGKNVKLTIEVIENGR